MATVSTRVTDEEVVKLARAERDAGVPDVQTAAVAAESKRRQTDTDAEIEAHPS